MAGIKETVVFAEILEPGKGELRKKHGFLMGPPSPKP